MAWLAAMTAASIVAGMTAGDVEGCPSTARGLVGALARKPTQAPNVITAVIKPTSNTLFVSQHVFVIFLRFLCCSEVTPAHQPKNLEINSRTNKVAAGTSTDTNSVRSMAVL